MVSSAFRIAEIGFSGGTSMLRSNFTCQFRVFTGGFPLVALQFVMVDLILRSMPGGSSNPEGLHCTAQSNVSRRAENTYLHSRIVLGQICVWLVQSEEVVLPELQEARLIPDSSCTFCILHSRLFDSRHEGSVYRSWLTRSVFTHNQCCFLSVNSSMTS